MDKKKPRVKKNPTNKKDETKRIMNKSTESTNEMVLEEKGKESLQDLKDSQAQNEESSPLKDASTVTECKNIPLDDNIPPIKLKDVSLEDPGQGSPSQIKTPETRGDYTTEPAATSSASATIQMLTDKNEKLRVKAIESLLKIANKSLGYAFVSAMKDESFRVRLGALRGLYKFGGDLATEYLIKALDDRHPDVRRRALIYLGWMRKKELVPYITSALADASSRVRRVATYALSDIKDLSAVPYLTKALDDVDQEVTKGAIAALKRITGKSFSSENNSPETAQKEIAEQYKEWWFKENS